ncbi:MAG: HD domain-containing protein [Planctomycetes bacterium]|nr:HD domain-containing protein [Planctomycetota bacterium]
MTDYEDIRFLDAEALAGRLLESVGAGHWPPVHTAVEWVMSRHGGQRRLDNTDFRCHPLRVAVILNEIADQADPNVLCGALLHDLLEDTDTQLADINTTFGGKVGDFVRALTLQDPREGQSKHERNMAHFEALRWEGRDAQIIRSADRLDNLKTLDAIDEYDRREDYLKESREGLLPLTLACNTALYHELKDTLDAAGA